MTTPIGGRPADVHDSIYDAASYDYSLPAASIAQAPLPRRDAARLLVVDRRAQTLGDAHVTDLPAILNPGDLLVFNDTRVIKARVDARRADTGGHAEVLIVNI